MISVSQATRPFGSSASTASSTVSEIWSAILSGWPSVTDSEVKRNSRAAMAATGYLISRKASKVRVSPSTFVQARKERSGLRFSVVELGRLWPARPAKPSSNGRASFRSM